jgi:hypothetical protein
MKPTLSLLLITCLSAMVFSQTKEDYQGSGKTTTTSLLDPSRFSIHHSVGFGMSTSSGSSLKSQSLYSTMVQYQFSQPVTLNLNFGLPIFSTYNPAQNLTTDNIKSADYFRNMPFNATLTWQAKDNLLFRLSVIHNTVDNYLNSGLPYSPLDRQLDYFGNRW